MAIDLTQSRRRAVAALAGSMMIAAGLWVSLDPALAPPIENGEDKYIHVAAYALLAAAWAEALPARLRWLVIPAVAALGGGIELLQGTIPGRIASPLDAASNGVGAALGFLAHRLLGRRGQ
ncbi:MAG: VanZ family protein [Alphaproteobacteria bacterium]|nr:VanZ family protein [Alphaproteobacteria bacterium]